MRYNRNMAYIKVWVNPGSKKEKLENIDATTYEISVKQPAERNLANIRIKELLALELKIPVQKIRMISGHRSGSKIFSIPDF